MSLSDVLDSSAIAAIALTLATSADYLSHGYSATTTLGVLTTLATALNSMSGGRFIPWTISRPFTLHKDGLSFFNRYINQTYLPDTALKVVCKYYTPPDGHKDFSVIHTETYNPRYNVAQFEESARWISRMIKSFQNDNPCVKVAIRVTGRLFGNDLNNDFDDFDSFNQFLIENKLKMGNEMVTTTKNSGKIPLLRT